MIAICSSVLYNAILVKLPAIVKWKRGSIFKYNHILGGSDPFQTVASVEIKIDCMQQYTKIETFTALYPSV